MSFNKNLPFILVLLILTSACSSYNSSRKTAHHRSSNRSLKGQFTINQRVAPPADIQSLNLHPKGRRKAPPIIKLNGSDPLTLEFDYLGDKARQFKLTVSHREKDWSKSPIPQNAYLSGFFETYFNGGQMSFAQNPGYFHYSYSFPNDQIDITKSGNYLLSVYDNVTGKLVFRIPFFVYEDAGKIKTHIQHLYAQNKNGRPLAQPFSIYQYPKFVQQPQFNLSFKYVQNRFWGRARSSKYTDTSTPGEVHFHLGRNKAFIANYEFTLLDLRSFQPNGQNIINLQPGKTPPVVTLRRNIQQFSKKITHYPGSELGFPRNELHAEYGNIHFSLVTRKTISPTSKIYIVGDFNDWSIKPECRMHYDSTNQIWHGKALVKQGIYAYKYVLLKNNTIDDLALDRSFTNSRQEYFTFVYFKDPNRNFDRLLQVKRIVEH